MDRYEQIDAEIEARAAQIVNVATVFENREARKALAAVIAEYGDAYEFAMVVLDAIAMAEPNACSTSEERLERLLHRLTAQAQACAECTFDRAEVEQELDDADGISDMDEIIRDDDISRGRDMRMASRSW